MAKKAATNRGGEKPNWIGFVNLDLVEKDKKAIKNGKLLSESQAVSFILSCLDDGYKFSCSWDEKYSCYVIALTGNTQDCENAGFTMTSRHSDFLTAVSSMSYKHVDLCDRGPWAVVGERQMSFDW